MKTAVATWKPATTYQELVQHTRRDFAFRLKQLRIAEKQIRAIEPDLRVLSEKHGLHFSTRNNSFSLQDRREPSSSRAQYVLFLTDASMSSDIRDRYVKALMDIGWKFEREGCNCHLPSCTVILRKPTTQFRIELYASMELRASLANPEAT